jgi:RNA polymerase sigma-19 factor, ECF subfamily
MFKADREPTARDDLSSFALDAYRGYRDQLRRYLTRRIRKAQDVEDVAQEVYLRLVRMHSAHDIHNPLAFIYRVAASALGDYRAGILRDSAHFALPGEVSQSALERAADSPSDRAEEIISIEQEITEALAELPPMHAAVFVLFEREEMSREEIAVQCGISVHTVKKYLTEARVQIRAKVWNTSERGKG